MKAPIAVDTAIGLTEKVVTTAANEHDLNATDRLITASVKVVLANAGYHRAENRESLLGVVKYWFIAKGSPCWSCIQYIDVGIKYNFCRNKLWQLST